LQENDFKVIELGDIDDKIKYCTDVILKEAKLEDRMVKQAFYALLSTYTSNPLNVKVEAPSGEGKNWVLGKVSDLFPKEDVMNLAGMTDKAIFHRAGKTVVKNCNNGEYEDIRELIKEYDSRIEDIDAELAGTRDTTTKSALKAKKQAVEEEKDDLNKNAMKLIDLSHRILLYLDTPRSGLINSLMSMLAHDSYETEYEYADNTSNGIKTKSNVLRGWPAVFYAQALDTSHYKRDAEANRRFIKINPNMAKEKYKAAARLIAEKWGTPDFMYQATVVSDAEKDRARQIIREIRDNLLSISGAVKPGRNNVIVPFNTAIIDALNTDDAQDMNTTQRLFTWLSLLPIVKLEKRPRIIIRRKDEIIREVMPLALFEDLKEAMFLMEYTSGVRPYISNWLDAVFLKILNTKTEVDKKTVDGFEKSEDRIALTTEQLVIATKEMQGKTLTAQQVYEIYLQPLMKAGFIDSKRSNLNQRNKIYWSTGLEQKSIIVPFLGRKTINDQETKDQNHDNSVLKSLADYIEKVVSRSSSECIFCEIFDHEGNEIAVSQLLEKYYYHKNGVVDDDQETEAESSSPDQTEPTFDRLTSETAKNDQRSSDLKQETMKDKSPPCLAIFSIMPLAHSGVSANNTTAATSTDTAAAASYPGAEYGAKIREEMRRLTCKEN